MRFYLVPKTGDGLTRLTAFRPKYIADLEGVDWAARDYGLEDVLLVGAAVTPAQHTLLVGNLDLIAIPQDLDQPIGLTVLTTLQAKLEGLHIPAEWLTVSQTYRDAMRVVAKLFGLMGRFHAREGRVFFQTGITLDTRMNQLSQAQRTALEATAVDLGLTVTGITPTTPVRQVLKRFADGLPGFVFQGEVL